MKENILHVFITGGLGFVGRHLSRCFLEQGHHVTATGYSEKPDGITHPNFHYIAADTREEGRWQNAVQEADAAVNLAGRSIFRYWTEKSKKEIYDSRILTTRNLVNALSRGNGKLLVSTSAVGYYGDGGEDILTEDRGPGEDFLARLAVDWENEARAAARHNIRVVIMRFGIVLGPNGGAMSKMIPAFRMFLGGPLGGGQQWFPWIHVDDLVQAAAFALNSESIDGPFNFCAPNPVRQKVLAKTLGRVLHRPAVVPAPAFFVKLFLGEFGSTLINSQRAVPRELQQHGFEFQYPDIAGALDHVVENR
jgi:uncharacterized protein (TIGR01777 family)